MAAKAKATSRKKNNSPAAKGSPKRHQGKDEMKDARSSAYKHKTSREKAAAQDRDLATLPPEVENLQPPEEPDRYSTRNIDRSFKAHLGRFTLGVTPAGLFSTFLDWLAHLAVSPGKQIQLIEKAQRKLARFLIFAASLARDPNTPPCIEPLPHDHRFDGDAWRAWPYYLTYQWFLLTQQWWHNASNDIDGLSDNDEHVVSFVTRQILDHFSPSNFIWTNPEVVQATIEQSGLNPAQGFQNLLEDWEHAVSGKPPVGAEEFVVGRDLATTPGQVVYRNHLIELIQYAPKTGKVRPEPILIVPAWIMKYYILDLSPHNSLVSYLVEQGFTVFMISWCNPSSADRDLGLNDYLKLGVRDALGAVNGSRWAGAFQLLRSNDLIWSRYVRQYLLGCRQEMFDLLAWNADATRMPYRMHSEYLRKIFLNNELAQGHYEVDGRPVTLSDIRTPIFCVATTKDHIAPWRSVYKIHLLTDTDVTFALTNGGHNAGVVSEPGHDGREFQVRTIRRDDKYIPPEEWIEETPQHDGSWWPAWAEWLADRSGEDTDPPGMGAPEKGYRLLVNAPGIYVYQR